MSVRKIAIIIERADTGLGGAERSVFDLSEALQSAGLDVHILAAKGKLDKSSNIRVHLLADYLPGKRIGFFTFMKLLKKHLSENYYDIIHSVLPFDFADIYQPRAGSYPEAILRNAASYENAILKTFKKITATVNIRRTILHRAEKKLCGNPNGPVVAALSKYVAEQFKNHYDLANKRIAIIPNGVKIDVSPSAAETYNLSNRIFSQFNIKEIQKPILFLFAANNFRLKGLTILIKALKAAISNNHLCYLFVIGNDNPSKYFNMAKNLGVEKYIAFLGTVSNVNPLFAISDVAVLPTYYDPSSRFILEALAAGKPVITTRFNGAVDLFTNNRHGIVLDNPDDVKSLADALQYFSNQENIRKASEAIVSDKLKDNISIELAAKQIIQLYENIVSKRGRKC